MFQLFGYKKLNDNSSKVQFDYEQVFQPQMEFNEGKIILFCNDAIQGEKGDHIFENSELLIIVQGNIYFQKEFFAKYPDLQKHQSNGAATIVAKLYMISGDNCFAQLNGDYIIILIEKRENILTVARDKMGGRKIYHTDHDGNLIISTNIKNLLHVSGVSRELNNYALESFIMFGYSIAPNTIFKSIKELEPGHLIKSAGDGYQDICYWKLNASRLLTESKDETRELLYEKIEENISLRIKPNDRIGIYLSGGIDSNTILGVLSTLIKPSDIHTMSIGYGEQFKDYHELNLARFSANHFGSTHHELINGPENIESNLCKMAWQFEQPFGNPALISWISLADLAKKHVDVVFVGAGPDEVLGGYNRHKALNFLNIYNKVPLNSAINKICKSIFTKMSVGANHYALSYRLRKLFETIRPDILQANEAMLHKDYSDLRQNLFLDAYLTNQTGPIPSMSTYYEMADTEDSFIKIFIADIYIDLVSEQFTRSFIPLDIFNIDYRAPFSDPDFLSMCLGFPHRYKANLTQTKILYKEAVSRILPERIIKQKKRGMSHPVNLWLQDSLYDSLKSILSNNNKALNSYFNMNFLNRIAEEHYSRKNDWGNLLWKMIVFSMWYKLFIDNKFTEMPEIRLNELVYSS